MENELIVRLVECAKPLQSTTDVVGWEDTTSIPKKGEICLEYYTETSAGDIDYGKVCYKMKIGDGVNTYANLPYFPTTKDINAKIAAWVNAHLNATDYAQASIDTTTKTLTIQGIGETGGIVHQAESFALQFVEGNKLDITVQKSNNLSSTITITHEATTTTSSTGTKRDFGSSVITGITVDSTGHITNIETSALPDNPVDANTVTAPNNLPENEIVLGNGTKTVKSSGKTITTTAPTSASTDSTIPTSKAVDTAVDTKINALDSEVNAGTNKVLTGVTQTDGKLTAKADVNYTDIAPVQNVKSGNHITVSNSDNEYTVNHASIGTGSAVTPTADGNTGWAGDVVTTVERDTYGHISGVKTKKIPSNPVSAGSTTTNQLMKSDGDSTTSPSGFTASNGNINESGSANTTTLPTTSAIVTYVQDKMGDLAGALIYKGTINSASNLPSNPTTGWMYVVATAGTYAGKVCEIGDYLIYNGSSWDVINGGNQVDDKNATLPWNTQTTIAEVDGTAIHVTLPENPVNDLDATNKGAASISGSTITIKAVSQNNGLIEDGDSTTINLDGTYNAADNKIATVSTVTNAVNALDVANDKGAASISDSTITINAVQQENGLIKDGGSTTINLDGTYNATDNKIATQTTVSNAIDNLDVAAYSQATVNTTSVQGQTTLTIKGIKEVNGKIAADNTTNIKTDILIDGTYSNNNKLATQTTVDTAVTNAINNLDESEDIGAMTFDTTEQSITVKAVQQEDGKIKDGGSTVIKLGDGLIATVDTSNNNVVSVDSDSIVAGDIKDPDIYSDNNDWNYRQTANGSTEAAGTDVAKLNPLKGNTIVWNQLNGFSRFEPNTVNNVTSSKSGNTITVTVGEGGPTAGANIRLESGTTVFTSGHTYYFSVETDFQMSSTTLRFGPSSQAWFSDNKVIWKWPESASPEGWFGIRYETSTNAGTYNLSNIQLIDLTKLFGSDEQIAAALGITVAEITTDKAVQAFEKLFPLPYYNYNKGELISLGGFAKTFNVWDEEWEVGNLSNTNGSEITDNQNIRSGYNRVISNTTYYIKSPVSLRLWYYDSDKNVIQGSYVVAANGREYTAPSNAAYFRFGTIASYGATYKHDICINISNAAYNGEYLPYGESLPFAIKSIGFNQWDEEWETGGIDSNTGQDSAATTRVRSKSYIKVIPSIKYYFRTSQISGNNTVFYYDINKIYITSYAISGSNPFETPANCRYIRFHTTTIYGGTYNHDICINISDPSRNGTYEPYKKYTLDLDWIKTLKLNDELLFPYGLCSAGSVYDEVGEDYAIKRVGAVDLGSLNWKYLVYPNPEQHYFTSVEVPQGILQDYYNVRTKNPKYTDGYWARVFSNTLDMCLFSNGASGQICITDSTHNGDDLVGDTATTKKAPWLSGVMLYYELATPIIIHFNKKSMYYVVDDKGTEQLLPVNDADPVTAPIRGQVDYHSNIKEVVKDLIGTSSGDTYTLTSNKASSSSTNDASITLTDSNGNKQSITVPFSAIRNDENITIILNGNF